MPITVFVALKWSWKDLLNESMKLYLAPITHALTHPFRSCQWSICKPQPHTTMHMIGIQNPELSPTKSWTLRYSSRDMFSGIVWGVWGTTPFDFEVLMKVDRQRAPRIQNRKTGVENLRNVCHLIPALEVASYSYNFVQFWLIPFNWYIIHWTSGYNFLFSYENR